MILRHQFAEVQNRLSGTPKERLFYFAVKDTNFPWPQRRPSHVVWPARDRTWDKINA